MPPPPADPFAETPALKKSIRDILAHFNEPSLSRMKTKIRHDLAAARTHQTAQTAAQVRHTLAEFAVGLHLHRCGYAPAYNEKLDGQTPDWYDKHAGLVVEVFTIEQGGMSAIAARVASRIAEKVQKYSPAVRRNDLSFVVAVHGDVLSGFGPADCEQAIAQANLFGNYPDLSGVIFFAECGDEPSATGLRDATTTSYVFTYFANANALRTSDLEM